MKARPKLTISAGGIVRTVIKGEVHIVLIRDSERHDWILPKGHLEEGETIEEAALRLDNFPSLFWPEQKEIIEENLDIILWILYKAHQGSRSR